MQIINNPGGNNFGAFTITGSGTTVIQLAAANVRGIVINSVHYVWSFGAINGGVGALIDCGGFDTLAFINEDIGPTGLLNVARTALFNSPVQVRSGFDLRLIANFSGSPHRLSVAINYRIL